MAARPTKRLSDALARRVVTHCTDCLQRATIPSPVFAASRPVEGFERAYDTLVLEFEPPQPALSQPSPVELNQSQSGPTQTPPELVREALLLLQALSACPGYAFDRNFAFWNATLAQEDLPAGTMPAKTGLQFPRVVLDWNPDYDGVGVHDFDFLGMFESSVLVLFTTPPSWRFSRDGRKLLASLREFEVSTHQSMAPIQCVVSIRFARAAKDTKLLVDSVILAAKALISQATSASQIQSELAWVGVCLNGSHNIRYQHRGLVTLANLKLLRRLCVSLPASVAFDFALPRSDPDARQLPKGSVREPLVAFMMLAIGVSGTELLGRLTMLDLTCVASRHTDVPSLDFASLCTLLPLSRSLRKLRVTAKSQLDILWLVYAATHPLTPTTQWRALHIEDCPWWVHLDRVVAFPSLLSALWTETINPSKTFTTATDPENLPDHFVRRTAKIAQDVQFFSPDKTKTVVQLVRGQNVELCDSTTPLDELVLETGDPDLDDVAVVVAGVGLGWVHKQDLTQITDTRYDGMARSCLTTLILAFDEEDVIDLNNMLPFFGPALRHLSASGAARTAIGDVPRVCPRLETLEMAIIIRGEDQAANALPVMPHLRFVCLVCGNLSSLSCSLRWLQSLPSLDTVRLLLGSPFTEDDPEWDDYAENDPGWDVIAAEDHLTAFIAAKARTLRSVTVIHTQLVDAARVGVDDRLSCDASSKRALLSVLHRARDDPRESRSALVRVGSDVVRLVIDFAGASLTHCVVQAYDMRPSDWCDSHNPNY